MFTIAEIGQAHEGSLGIAHSYIDALAETGVDAIKFQTHIAAAESSLEEPFRVKFSYEDDTRFDYWKRMEFTQEQWIGLKKHCDEKGVEFISSPFSIAAVELLETLGVKNYKIGSGEVSNFLMLDRIAKTGKHLMISSGISSFEELDKTIAFLRNKNSSFSLFQCTTAYPTKAVEWGLNVIGEMKERYGVPVGFSDHSGDIFACLAATSLGADFLEFHAVFDKRMFGPDSKSSLTIDEIKQLIHGVKQIHASLNTPIDKSDNSRYAELKNIFEKSLVVNKSLGRGNVLTIDDLDAKKPKGLGIDAKEYMKVIGKELTKDLKAGDFLTYNDI